LARYFSATSGAVHKRPDPVARADIKGSIIMTHFGKIKSYDSAKGAGMITPYKGGDALAFNKSDLQQQAQEPLADQRYGYDTRQVDGGKAHATNLQMEAGTSDSSAKQQS
jgi:CspA family cold shock protein